MFKEKCQEHHFKDIVVHMPYLPNLATNEDINFTKSVQTLLEEVKRCNRLNIPFLVLHLGSHKGKGTKVGIQQIVKSLDKVIATEPHVRLCLENSAGTKNSIGSKFEEIGEIIEKVSDPDKIGVCFDTCHGFAAGYDLRDSEAVENTLNLFETSIDLRKLFVIHANDSKNQLNSRKDRHEHIGLGGIGSQGFKEILKQFPKVLYILETPNDDRRKDIENLAFIRALNP